jgi:hypothetical protein
LLKKQKDVQAAKKYRVAIERDYLSTHTRAMPFLAQALKENLFRANEAEVTAPLPASEFILSRTLP